MKLKQLVKNLWLKIYQKSKKYATSDSAAIA